VAVLLRRSLAAVVRSPFASRLFLASFVLQLGAQLCFPYVPLFVQALYRPVSHGHVQAAALATTIGWVLTAAGAAGAIATPLWGRAGDRFGHVRVLTVAVAFIALTLVVQYAAPTLVAFAAARTAYGAVQVALSALTFAALATRIPEAQRASILNLGLFPFYIAAVLAPTAATLLLPLGLPSLFLVAALVSLLAVPPLLSIPALS
jgi:DHA1 family multidrug resistance protein-like MFS transporter